MNLQFDLTWLSAWDPCIAVLLAVHRPTLVDVSILNSLDYEARPERDLKSLSRILMAARHESPFRDGFRFAGPSDPALHRYCAQDTLAAILCASELARRLVGEQDGVSGFGGVSGTRK